MSVNEIIGRALLALKDSELNGLVEYDGISGTVMLDGHFSFTDIGAAVVKALADAGYEIVRKP